MPAGRSSRCRRTGRPRCTAGSSPARGERPRCGRRHGRGRSPRGTGEVMARPGRSASGTNWWCSGRPARLRSRRSPDGGAHLIGHSNGPVNTRGAHLRSRLLRAMAPAGLRRWPAFSRASSRRPGGLLARAPPGRPAADRAVPHLGPAARARAAGMPGRDDVAGVHAAAGDGRPQGRLQRAVEPVDVLAPQAVHRVPRATAWPARGPRRPAGSRLRRSWTGPAAGP